MFIPEVNYNSPMNRWVTLWAVMAAGFLGAAGTHASVETNRGADTDYRTIIDRNPFGLKPPPPPQTNAPPATAPPKNDIKLTGFTVFGQKKAYFMATTAGKQEFYTLAAGEGKDGLEVVEIDDTAKSVRVRNGGVETVMTFATHGNAVPNTAPPATPGQPGANPTVTTAFNMPAAPGMPPNPANTVAGGRTAIPSRTLRTQTGMAADGGMVRTYGGLPGMTTMATPGQPVSNMPVITAPAPPNPNNLSGEQQIIMLELQKIATQKANPRIVLPPTPGLPGLPGQ